MQEIGNITKNHKYKDKQGEEKQHNINVIPNNIVRIHGFHAGQTFSFTAC